MSTTTFDTKQFKTAIKKADDATGTAIAQIDKAADILLQAWDKEADLVEETRRLQALGKSTIQESKLKLAQERNIYLFLNQSILIKMNADYRVEFKTKGGSASEEKRPTTLVPAAECKTARQRNEAAKQIRDAIGMSDKRSGNGKKPSAVKLPSPAEVFVKWLKSNKRRNQAAANKLLRPLGFELKAIQKAKPETQEKATKGRVVSKDEKHPANA